MGDDELPEVQVHQARGGELGLVLWEGGVEGALMVVVAVLGGRVFSADVDDGMADGEDGGVAGTDDRGTLVGG